MRLSFLALAVLVPLGGCTNGYVIDHIRPKTYLIEPQLSRYGLDPTEAQCLAQRLGSGLSVWQLRQFATAAGTIRPGGAYPAELTWRELRWAAANVKDPKIAEVVESALPGCGIKEEMAVAPVQELPSSAPAQQAPAAPSNGPANYEPSQDLWAAFEAHEKGDFATAARLARSAAENGDSAAQQFLGALYQSGQGVKKDPREAAKWFWLAAEHGWSEAMNNLGKAFETGRGVARDPVQALKWYLLASRRPNEDSLLVERNIQSVSANMTPEQLAEAGKLARQWEQSRRVVVPNTK